MKNLSIKIAAPHQKAKHIKLIIQAITQAETFEADAIGRIVIPAGTYLVTETIQLQKGVSIIGSRYCVSL